MIVNTSIGLTYEQPSGGTSPVPVPMSGTLQKLRLGGSADPTPAPNPTRPKAINAQQILDLRLMVNASPSPG
jgi:hypothetical protein